MTAVEQANAALDAVAHQIATHAAFDISPRGVSLRPDPVLAASIRSVVDQAPGTVHPLSTRLLNETDVFAAIVWIECLVLIGGADAAQAIDAFLQEADRQARWQGGFPGMREIRLFAGRAPARGR
jgi:hypothetical protein